MGDRVKHETIGAALCAAIADVEFVVESGRNTHHNYNYANDTDLLRSVRPAMIRHGLALVPHEMAANRSGGLTEVHATYLLVHADSEQTLKLAVVGEGSGGRGSEDKGVYKALTGCYKYLLRHTFAIPTGDDAEATKWDTRRDAPETKEEKAARRAKHDPEWEDGGRERFMVRLSELGLKYDALRWFITTRGKDKRKPSERSAEERAEILNWLEDPAQVERVQRDFFEGGR